MKKQITVLSGLLLFAGVSFGQNLSVKETAKLTRVPQFIAPFNGVAKTVNNGGVKAQGTVLWSSDMSDSTVWTKGTAGQGSFIFLSATTPNSYFGNMASTTAANGYAYFNGVKHLIAGAVDPQDAWIETPVIDFTGKPHARLSFEQRYRAFNSDETKIEYSADGGTTWTTSMNINEDAVGNGASIQSFEGYVFATGSSATGKFRFRWVCASDDDNYGSGYGWMIDDVSVATLDDNDLVYTYGFHHTEAYQYSQIPTHQIAPIVVRAGVRNDGANSLTNVTLNLAGDATGVSTPMTLASLAVDTLETTFTPSATVGTKTITTSLTMTETDDRPANNDFSKDVKFDVTEHIFAVDKGAPYGDFPLYSLAVGGNPVVITGVGTTYDIVQNSSLRGLDFMLYSGGTGQNAVATEVGAEVYAELYEMNPEATTLAEYWTGPIGYSDMFVVENASQINQMQTLPFSNPINLVAGKTYLALIAFSGSAHIEFAAGAGTLDTDQGWMKVQGTQAWGTFKEIPVVRMNFDPSLSIADKAEAVTGVSIYPNPATEVATVKFNAANASDVTINVVDVTGKTVQTVVNKAVAGANAVALNVNGLANGIYTVVINANDTKATQKLVIK